MGPLEKEATKRQGHRRELSQLLDIGEIFLLRPPWSHKSDLAVLQLPELVEDLTNQPERRKGVYLNMTAALKKCICAK